MIGALRRALPSAVLIPLAIASTLAPPLDCLDAFRKRNALAVRAAELLNREVDRGYLNRAERGALNAAVRGRYRLLACGPERAL